MAAEQGQKDAQYEVGTAYEHGWGGVSIDYKEAAKWYNAAAEQGHKEAQMAIPRMRQYLNYFGN